MLLIGLSLSHASFIILLENSFSGHWLWLLKGVTLSLGSRSSFVPTSECPWPTQINAPVPSYRKLSPTQIVKDSCFTDKGGYTLRLPKGRARPEALPWHFLIRTAHAGRWRQGTVQCLLTNYIEFIKWSYQGKLPSSLRQTNVFYSASQQSKSSKRQSKIIWQENLWDIFIY